MPPHPPAPPLPEQEQQQQQRRSAADAASHHGDEDGGAGQHQRPHPPPSLGDRRLSSRWDKGGRAVVGARPSPRQRAGVAGRGLTTQDDCPIAGWCIPSRHGMHVPMEAVHMVSTGHVPASEGSRTHRRGGGGDPPQQ